jgi:23S rRNA (guanosine2251-2'-O)-methyltransferase
MPALIVRRVYHVNGKSANMGAPFQLEPRPDQMRKQRTKDIARGHRQPGGEAPTLIFGIHAVEAALRNPRRPVRRLLLTDNAEHRLAQAVAARGVQPERVIPRDLDRRLGQDTVHQGALLETDPLAEPELSDLARPGISGKGPLLILDHVTDPHNVGAILRSAAVFGSAGLVMTRRHSPPPSGALAKSASGALEVVPVLLVQNLARAMQELKALGYRCLGLDGAAPDRLEEEDLSGAVALVLGAEGRGLRPLTRESCDRLCRIEADGPLDSLNVSNAAAVALHLAAMSRRRAGGP